MSDTGGRDQEVGAESVAASVCEDFVFWRRVSKLAPLNRIKSQCEPEPLAKIGVAKRVPATATLNACSVEVSRR